MIQSSNLNRNRRDNKRVESRVDTVNPGNTFFSWPAGYLRFGTPRLDDQFSTVRQVDRSFTDTKKQSARSINYRACTSDGLEIDLPRPIRLASIAPLFIPGQICWEIFIRHFLHREKKKKERNTTVSGYTDVNLSAYAHELSPPLPNISPTRDKFRYYLRSASTMI